ncbi:hypothetical protein BD311DRAFT_865244 [Dichomitus squalens]|uniref:F-box domain-containing protein n=1 Tax=Dichomitus squalens TaxID=114155 RepID=A0A4Q9MMK0_9APHY|nr:hypothetical protein BD311DRAFT_865244 [Dichomitus squalens]
MQHGPLSRLPFELLEMIFQYLEDIPWIALFAITCKSLLALSKPHLLRAFRNTYAFCANCRMILLQDHSINVAQCWALVEDAELPPDKQKRRARDWNIPIYDTWYQDAMRYLVVASPKRPGSKEVLFNIAKREYVRGDALASGQDSSKRWSLEDVLLFRIHWDGEEHEGQEGGRWRMEGSWAGDRFCVSSMEELDRLRVDAEWEDVASRIV